MSKIYKLNGTMYQEPVSKDFDFANAFEVLSPILEDGTFIKNHPLAKDLPKKEDGTFYAKYNEDLTANIEYENELALKSLSLELKASLLEQLETLTVEVNGKIFNADKVSRQNMTDAIGVASDFGLTETTWRLVKGSEPREQIVTLEELKQARMAALTAYANLKAIGKQ